MEQILYSCQQNLHLREREREKGTIFSPYSLVNGKRCPKCQQVNLTVLQLHSLCWECWFLVSGIRAELLEPQPVQAAGSCVTPKQCPVSLWQPR